MRPISRSFLAQLLVHQLDGAVCRGHGQWWSEQEAAVQAATTNRRAAAASRPALRLCAGCPASVGCAERAELDEYYGIAAGAIYQHGKRIEVSDFEPTAPGESDLADAPDLAEAG